METQNPSLAKTVLYNKNAAIDIYNPNFKLHYIVLA